MALIVQKYGGTSVGNTDRIKNVAARVAKYRAQGDQIVVVVSAMSGVTDGLIRLAKEIAPLPSEREMDMLLATGEQQTIALTAIALHALLRGVGSRPRRFEIFSGVLGVETLILFARENRGILLGGTLPFGKRQMLAQFCEPPAPSSRILAAHFRELSVVREHIALEAGNASVAFAPVIRKHGPQSAGLVRDEKIQHAAEIIGHLHGAGIDLVDVTSRTIQPVSQNCNGSASRCLAGFVDQIPSLNFRICHRNSGYHISFCVTRSIS